LSAPKILHKAGVIEKDPYEQFLAETVLPSLEKIRADYSNTEFATERVNRPGYKLKNLGARVKYPIVMVPGFVTSGLELWGGEDCARKHFRQRFWGSMSMAKTFFADRECWRRHLTLDPYTGSDPPSIRLRAAQGFEAADYFMATYWVWSKLIENLADIGYDGSTMTMMSYDWRLGYNVLETRDACK
jgi:phospholipid:diacylglycerol acyltransferase